MSEILSIGFSDAQSSVHAFARAGAGALIWVRGRLSAPAQVQLDQTRLSAQGLSLDLEPSGEAARLADGASHQPCRVTGDLGGESIACAGTLIRAPKKQKAAVVRDIAVRLQDGPAVALRASRARASDAHGSERIDALVRHPAGAWSPVADPRLSSTYDARGELLRSGLELWESEEGGVALRLAARVLAYAELGEARVSLCEWRGRGSAGGGHYAM